MRSEWPLRSLRLLLALTASVALLVTPPALASSPDPSLGASALPSPTSPSEAPSSDASPQLLPEAGVSGEGSYCVLVPDRQEVRDLVAEFTGPQHATFLAALRRSGRYLPMIRRILAEEGLPPEVGYLALVESHFIPDARSATGALGLWQFIESTARDYGLRIDAWADERLDPEAATRAAVRHLSDLYARFGDWNLAVAAYNAGPGGVGRALEAHGADSFWDLFARSGLRAQTCRYVVKFLAAVAIAASPGAYGLDVGAAEEPLSYDTVWVDSPIDLVTVARLLGLPSRTVRDLNPALRRDCTPPDAASYPVRVPPDRGSALTREIANLPRDQRLAFVRHKVRRGETLTAVARRYGVKSSDLAEANRLPKKPVLRAGQELLVPRVQESAPPPSGTAASRDVHVVRSGDTVWGISRRYGITPGQLLRWNHRESKEIRPGERLLVSERSDAGPG